MKHEIKVTLLILFIFVLTQIAGLSLLMEDIQYTSVSNETGEIIVVHSPATEQARPDTKGFDSFTYLILGIVFATALLLVIIRFSKKNLWIGFYAFAVFTALSIAISVLIESMLIVYLLSAALAFLKIWRPNFVIHNLSEILVYSGIAILFIPLFSVFWMFVVLAIISVYDVIAVRKSKHMVKMAEFTAKSKLFPGITVPYKGKKISFGKLKELKTGSSSKGGSRTAILGGGDIVFPLIFSGVVLESLVAAGVPEIGAFFQALVITATTTIALALLFFLAKKHRYYPAMPALSAGCVVGWLILLLF
ncbi:MAG: presenilin family intramembrane aspartyl protease [Candidatus Woesearchaeota archaeon]